METLQDALARAEREHIAKTEKLKQEHTVRAALAARVPGLVDYVEPSIYVSPLYGRVGEISFKSDRYESLRPKDRKQPDRGLVDLLTSELPGRPMTKFADGCLSFRLTSYVDSLPDEKVERVDITPIAPWRIEADPNHFSDTVSVTWLAELAGQVWQIRVEFPRWPCKIGLWDISVKRTSHGEIDHVVRCELRPDFPDAPEPPQRVRWATGGHTSLNSFTLWWYDSEPAVLEHIRRGILAALPEASL